MKDQLNEFYLNLYHLEFILIEHFQKEGKKNDESKTEKDKEVEEKGKKEPEMQSSEHMVRFSFISIIISS